MIKIDQPLQKKHLTDLMSFSEPDVIMVGYNEHVVETHNFKQGMFERIDVLDSVFPNRPDLNRVNLFTAFRKQYSTIVIDMKTVNVGSRLLIDKLIRNSKKDADVFLHGTPDESIDTFLNDDSLELKAYTSNVEGDFVALFKRM